MEDEDILKWAECRLSRFYWLEHMTDVIRKVERRSFEDYETQDFLMNHLLLLAGFKKKLFEGSNCIPGCKALCCYFSKDHYNQVPITRDEFGVLSETLAGDKLEDHLSMVPYEKISPMLEDYLKKSPEFIFTLHGAPMVCMLNPSNRVIDGRLLEHAPKTARKSMPMWVDENSRACRFLNGDGKCVLYGKVRFTVCREFYCLTAATLAVLGQMGFADEVLSGLPMGELNRIAENVATAFRSRGIVSLEREYDSQLRELAIAYVTQRETKEGYRKIREYEEEYDNKLRQCIKTAMEDY